MKRFFYFFFLLMFNTSLPAQYLMPAENEAHEGTWLQWPHDYTYGEGYRDYLEASWIVMTGQLIKGEKVHIICYDETERLHIESVLTENGISLLSVDFYLHPTDDFWVRDNGPIFVYDSTNTLMISDWNFDGWGNDYAFEKDDLIPQYIAEDISMERLDVSGMTLEGGAFETDGNGTFMATKSSILGDDRNPGFTTTDAENYLSKYLGVNNFIWLDGAYGGTDDVTDMHIDGFAKFTDTNTIITMDSSDLLYWYLPSSDITALYHAKNKYDKPYNYVFLPLTKHNVKTSDGINIGYKSSYVNYYVANAVVLVPVYEDENDSAALSIIQSIYPGKEVVGIDSRNIAYFGGMIHCATQQQPVSLLTGIQTIPSYSLNIDIYPNPFSETITVGFQMQKSGFVVLHLYDAAGNEVKAMEIGNADEGFHSVQLETKDLRAGLYIFSFMADGLIISRGKLICTGD